MVNVLILLGQSSPRFPATSEVSQEFRRMRRAERAVDLVDICPFYFHLKPLFAKPSMDDEPPPIRAATPAPPRRLPTTVVRKARPIPGAPPSPSPSLSRSPSPVRLLSPSIRSSSPRPGPADAGPSSRPFSLRPTRSRPPVTNAEYEFVSSGARSAGSCPHAIHMMTSSPSASPAPSSSTSSDTTTDSSDICDESEHDMENDWCDQKPSATCGPSVAQDWLNLRHVVTRVDTPAIQANGPRGSAAKRSVSSEIAERAAKMRRTAAATSVSGDVKPIHPNGSTRHPVRGSHTDLASAIQVEDNRRAQVDSDSDTTESGSESNDSMSVNTEPAPSRSSADDVSDAPPTSSRTQIERDVPQNTVLDARMRRIRRQLHAATVSPDCTDDHKPPASVRYVPAYVRPYQEAPDLESKETIVYRSQLHLLVKALHMWHKTS